MIRYGLGPNMLHCKVNRRTDIDTTYSAVPGCIYIYIHSRKEIRGVGEVEIHISASAATAQITKL